MHCTTVGWLEVCGNQLTREDQRNPPDPQAAAPGTDQWAHKDPAVWHNARCHWGHFLLQSSYRQAGPPWTCHVVCLMLFLPSSFQRVWSQLTFCLPYSTSGSASRKSSLRWMCSITLPFPLSFYQLPRDTQEWELGGDDGRLLTMCFCSLDV